MYTNKGKPEPELNSLVRWLGEVTKYRIEYSPAVLVTWLKDVVKERSAKSYSILSTWLKDLVRARSTNIDQSSYRLYRHPDAYARSHIEKFKRVFEDCYFEGNLRMFLASCEPGLKFRVIAPIVRYYKRDYVQKCNGSIISQRSGAVIDHIRLLHAGHKNEGNGGGAAEIAEAVFYSVGELVRDDVYRVNLKQFCIEYINAHLPFYDHFEFISVQENADDKHRNII